METTPGTPEFQAKLEALKEKMGTKYLLHEANKVHRLDGKVYLPGPARRPKLRKVG